MRQGSLLVVDDFYAEPEKVRSLALATAYHDVRDLNYPGFQSQKVFTSQSLEKRIAELIGEEIVVNHSKHSFGKFRVMLESTGSRLKVHLDGHADWTGLIYLNSPGTEQGGTGFYRHRRTGLDGPPSPDVLASFGYQNWRDFERAVVSPDSLSPEAWEMTDFVAMKFNRLVLFRGSQYFHCHTVSFGTDFENGRMTQNFFFDQKRNSPETIYNTGSSDSSEDPYHV